MFVFDARAISSKPCGVSRVSTQYLYGLVGIVNLDDIIVLVNEGCRGLVPNLYRVIEVPKKYHRLSFIDNIYLFVLLKKINCHGFFSFHSWLPVFLPRCVSWKGFLLHDLLAVESAGHFKSGLLTNLVMTSLFKVVTYLSVRVSDVVITPTNYIANKAKTRYDKLDKFQVVSNGVLPCAVMPVADQESDRMLFVGNFRSYKGFDILISVLTAKVNVFSGIKLEVVTNESKERIAWALSQLVNFPNVRFHHSPSDQTLSDIRSRCKYALVPSREEGFGLPLIESIYANLIPVYPRIDVFSEIMETQEAGLSYRPGDDLALSSILEAIVARSDAKDALNKSDLTVLKKKLLQRFSWPASCQTLANIIFESGRN